MRRAHLPSAFRTGPRIVNSMESSATSRLSPTGAQRLTSYAFRAPDSKRAQSASFLEKENRGHRPSFLAANKTPPKSLFHEFRKRTMPCPTSEIGNIDSVRIQRRSAPMGIRLEVLVGVLAAVTGLSTALPTEANPQGPAPPAEATAQ